MPARRPHRPFRDRLDSRLLTGGLIAGALLVVLVAAAAAYDQSRSDRLAQGITIAGVKVGGLDVATARHRILSQALKVRRRTLRVHADDQVFELSPTQAKVTVDVSAALARAVADSRRGWLGARVFNGLTGHHVNEDVPLPTRYDPAAVNKLVAQVARFVAEPPVDAKAVPGPTGLATSPGQNGRVLKIARLRRRLINALVRPPRSTDIVAVVTHVHPKVTEADLAAKYPAYVIVDRADHVLRYYKHLKPTHTFPIAVGMAGLETPAGLYDIQWKEVDPPWRVPNSAWAGKLAGRTIPPGPDDPIKARWMAFNGGAGIHGIDPSEYGSIGHDASHGCVRMRIPDVIALYDITPVGTPVFIA